MLLFHHPAHQPGEILLARAVGIARLLRGDDISAEEEVGDEVRVRKTGVLGLHVIDALPVLDVVVEPDDRGSAARAHKGLSIETEGPSSRPSRW